MLIYVSFQIIKMELVLNTERLLHNICIVYGEHAVAEKGARDWKIELLTSEAALLLAVGCLIVHQKLVSKKKM